MNEPSLAQAAAFLADRLQHARRRIVFAESCTAGLAAASLARVPGVSEFLCGSAVVYRNATKTAWLGVSADDLANESVGAVSESVAAAMAIGVLTRTPEADLGVSVTGHLGPDAPPDLDGVVFVGVARRHSVDQTARIDHVRRCSLRDDDPDGESPLSIRHDRQRRAAEFVLRVAAASLAKSN